ncbi:MAG: hypothetical protein EZS28_024304 [Streblomastix strix]|uniref:Uncharacterized protein n=1 Tax=Streblomastix strix TaxID=222440 RepID=A0A5J4VC66_9EUKA|nr:MAG: hypothetical protein EZS28_024304 [Streblomastix strix]
MAVPESARRLLFPIPILQSNRNIRFKGNYASSNAQFKDGQLIAMELNADFWIFYKESSFSIVSVKKLVQQNAKTLPNEKAVQW